MLAEVDWREDTVILDTTEGRQYILDLNKVNGKEVRKAQRILRKMNADQSFRFIISSNF